MRQLLTRILGRNLACRLRHRRPSLLSSLDQPRPQDKEAKKTDTRWFCSGVGRMALYDTIGGTYAQFRRPDQRIASAIEAALGDATSVVNIGAGTGSYEPPGRTVIAVEPSEVMIRQRPAGAAPCLQGSAEALPLETASVDAAMAVLSAHHWTDLERGFREMARVARKRAVLLTWVPDAAPFWLTEDYFPEIAAHDRTIFPSAAALTAMLERMIGPVHMAPVPIPHDCTDGLLVRVLAQAGSLPQRRHTKRHVQLRADRCRGRPGKAPRRPGKRALGRA